ncbi:MAG: cupin domain-containing protein [Actinomycetota bacterium]|nr:cupin domain-containing protein [Actinomycetota bacterium]
MQPPLSDRGIGHLDEVLNNIGVFLMDTEELPLLCQSGFRRVPISQGNGHYMSLQAFAPNQVAYAHTHPDSEEWTVVLRGAGRARVRDDIQLSAGSVLGRAAAFPHGFVSGHEPMYLLSIQLPRPGEGSTTWDEAGTTTEPRTCPGGGRCRRCSRCGGHSAEVRVGLYECENCTLEF